MKVEYLIIIDKEKEMCTTKESFLSFLRGNANISVENNHILYKSILKVEYFIQDGSLTEENFIYYHLIFTSKEEDIEDFTKLLKSIRKTLSNIHGSNIQVLWDDVTLYYSEKAYPIIHNIENLMRKLITKFMIINVGNQWTKNTLPDELKTKENSKNTNLLYNTDFIDLSKFLFEGYRTVDVTKLADKISSLSNQLTTDDLNAIKGFIPKSNWERYFNNHVDCEAEYLSKRWEKLYILRCAVAHNNSFHKQDYADLVRNADEVREKITEAIKQLDNVVIPETEKESLAEEYAISANEITGKFINRWKEIENILFKISSSKLFNKEELNVRSLLKSLKDDSILEEQMLEDISYYNNIRNNIVHNISSDLSLNTIYTHIEKLEKIYKSLTNILYSDNFFWLNSNIKFSGDSWKKMLALNLACTYGPEKYGRLLNKVKEGDFILLYISEQGIVAGGVVISEFTGKKNMPALTIDEQLSKTMPEYSIGVDWKYRLTEDNLINIPKIRELGQNHFMGTLFRVNSKVGHNFFEELGEKQE